jgi:hypothetical protein
MTSTDYLMAICVGICWVCHVTIRDWSRNLGAH